MPRVKAEIADQRSPNSKTDTMDSPFILVRTLPKERVTRTDLFKKSFTSNPSFTERGNIHRKTFQLLGDKSCPAFWSVGVCCVH